MAFDIRCPECQAKLRLDEAPDADTPIECPRCGSLFTAPGKAARKEKAARTEKPKPKGAMPKKRKVKKKKTNPIILVGAIVAGFASLIGVGFLMVYFLNRAGKVEEMLTYVPDSCNWARGVNVSQLAKYPGYKAEVEKYMTGPVTAAANELAAAAGHDPDRFVDYLIVAKNRGDRGASTMYVFRTQRSFRPDALGAELNGGVAQGDGTYKMPGAAPGVLAGATLYRSASRSTKPAAATTFSGTRPANSWSALTFSSIKLWRMRRSSGG
jgi:hypothetical protein